MPFALGGAASGERQKTEREEPEEGGGSAMSAESQRRDTEAQKQYFIKHRRFKRGYM